MLRADVQEILTSAKKHEEYKARHRDSIEACSGLVHTLEAVAAASLALDAAEDVVLSSDLPTACETIANMQSLMKALPSAQSQLGAGPVCKVALLRARSLVFSSIRLAPVRFCDTLLR